MDPHRAVEPRGGGVVLCCAWSPRVCVCALVPRSFSAASLRARRGAPQDALEALVEGGRGALQRAAPIARPVLDANVTQLLALDPRAPATAGAPCEAAFRAAFARLDADGDGAIGEGEARPLVDEMIDAHLVFAEVRKAVTPSHLPSG